MSEIIANMLAANGVLERILGILAGLSMAACLLTGCQSAGAELPDSFEEELVEEEALRSIDYFNEGDYQSIIDMGSKELKEAITAEEFAEQCDPMREKRGAFREIKKTVFLGAEKEGTEYGVAVLVGDYENGRITFHIGFDEDMKLVEFLVQ